MSPSSPSTRIKNGLTAHNLRRPEETVGPGLWSPALFQSFSRNPRLPQTVACRSKRSSNPSRHSLKDDRRLSSSYKWAEPQAEVVEEKPCRMYSPRQARCG